MKPHEETWTALRNTVRCGEHEQAAVFSSDLPGARASELDAERARLAAQAPAMARLWLKHEWSGLNDDEDPACPECGGVWPDVYDHWEGDPQQIALMDPAWVAGQRARRGHRPDCTLAAVLRAAGVLP